MAAPTGFTVIVDEEEYSRFEDGKDVITVEVTPEGSNLSGENVTIELVKARRNKDVSVAEKTLTLTSSSSTVYSLTFDLNAIRDNEDVPKVRRGAYLIRATSETNTNVTEDSDEFLISLVTVDNLRDVYLHGLDAAANEILDVHNQPTNITGSVKISRVSPDHEEGWFPLTYSYHDDGVNVVQSLSWCGGPEVILTSGTKKYTLRKGSSSSWIEVKVGSFSSLPTSTTTDEILIKKKDLDDKFIRNVINKAISNVEKSFLNIYLEPTKVITEVDTDAIVPEAGTDILTFEKADWDEIVNPISYVTPSRGRWINFRIPYKPLIRFDILYGKIANVRVLDVSLEWVEAHRQGTVQLVPFNQDTLFNFIGLVWVEALRGPVPLPNFWNFEAVVGYKETPDVLLELVSKLAAIDILAIAGQAFRGGFSSQSISREGVSESVSYTASAVYGMYSATIEEYKKWINENKERLRGAFRGPNMIVV